MTKFRFLFLLFLIFVAPAWASQNAIVIAEQAVIYSDKEMTSAVGYVARGKRILIGEIARNRSQVYPIVVAGKVAYIRALDISTERQSMDSNVLVAERFRKTTRDAPESKFLLSYFVFNSQVSIPTTNGTLSNNDPLAWNGISFKGEALIKKPFDVQVLVNHMFVTKADTTFRVVEAGLGGALRIIDSKYFLLRVEGHALGIPFATYSEANDFRLRSYGFSAGGGGAMTFHLGSNWGLEAYAGLYYTKLLAFSAPDPYSPIAPSFIGSRMGLGLNYTY